MNKFLETINVLNKRFTVLEVNFDDARNEGEIHYNAEIKLHRDIRNFKGTEGKN